MNDQSGQVNQANDLDGSSDTIPSVAKTWKSRSQPWMLVADHNYGEGSAREHAALQPRFYGCNLILARSIARIAETNLRKQGVLTLLFENEDDYNLISQGDLVETINLDDLIREGGDLNTQVRLRVTKFKDGKSVKETLEIPTKHSLSPAHLDWIRSGSALNLIKKKATEASMGGSSRSSASSSSSLGGVRSMSTSSRRPSISSKTSSSLQTRSYATATNKPSPTRLNPNDPNYVPPAADSRTESIRHIVYPPQSNTYTPTSTEEILGYPSEVHDTITRAWLLHKRQERESLSEKLRIKRNLMFEAVEDLKKNHPSLYSSASYRVNSNKRHPEEDLKLRKLGLLPGTSGNMEKQVDQDGNDLPQLSGPEIRRRLRAISGRRLHGLFPREMRVPTQTPAKVPFPKYVKTEEEKL